MPEKGPKKETGERTALTVRYPNALFDAIKDIAYVDGANLGNTVIKMAELGIEVYKTGAEYRDRYERIRRRVEQLAPPADTPPAV